MTRAAIPPMGWNSWDCYGTTVTEDEVLANARHLSHYLLPAGWDTVVVDIAWYDPTARAHGYNVDAPVELDQHGRQLPAPGRFPSAAAGQGFAPLAEQIHRLGLKFGLHLMRGIPRRAVDLDLPVAGTAWTARDAADTSSTCPWNPDNYGLNLDHPAGQAYLDSQIAQLASWGVDFLKVDDMLAPYHSRAIEALALAIDRCGRDITLSLSPGTQLSTAHVEHLRDHAHMWRISDDLWDRWEDVHAQFARLARWAPFQRPGGWADADMLPLGRIGIRAERGNERDSRLTLDEQRTLLTLWTMARSPLMMGGDLPASPPQTLALLANPAIRDVLQSSRQGREILREPISQAHDSGELIVWTASAAARTYVAVFWTGTTSLSVEVPLASLLGHLAGPVVVTDLWPSPNPTTAGGASLRATVPGHGVAWAALDPVTAAPAPSANF